MNAGAYPQVRLPWRGHFVDVEYTWVQGAAADKGVCVWLHEGLGSLRMWKDFPQSLCERMGWRGLVYSRPGYGGSTPRAPHESWGSDFMHRQAFEVLPALLRTLQLDTERLPIWLIGHSDGASIALLYASRFGATLAGCVAMAPHVMVEPITLSSIAAARTAYLEGPLRRRLLRYHADVDSAFWGWNDIWLKPEFREWTIESEIAAIACPLLLIQGQDDEYGTLQQLQRIQARVPMAKACILARCGHSAHRDAPHAVLDAIAGFCTTEPTEIRPLRTAATRSAPDRYPDQSC